MPAGRTIRVVVLRRAFLFQMVAAAASLPGLPVRGKLSQNAAHQPVLAAAGNKEIVLSGDGPSEAILHDDRLRGADLEVVGHFTGPDRFEIDPIHTVAMFVHKDGKRLKITYWCDVCYIRTLAPGTCVCCQKYTDLDLQDPSAQ
jgi:hypothetical protein